MSVAPERAGAARPALPPELATSDGRPALRLLPAPPCEPPYDDELPARSRRPAVRASVRADGTAGGTALATGHPGAAVVLRLVPPTAGDPSALAGPDDDEECRTPLASLPASRPFAQAFVQRLLEVLAGLRPLGQLQRDTSFELFCRLEHELNGRSRPPGPRPSRRDVRSVHVQEHEHGVAEVCATVRRGGRMTALALRMEGVDGAWRCTSLTGV